MLYLLLQISRRLLNQRFRQVTRRPLFSRAQSLVRRGSPYLLRYRTVRSPSAQTGWQSAFQQTDKTFDAEPSRCASRLETRRRMRSCYFFVTDAADLPEAH